MIDPRELTTFKAEPLVNSRKKPCSGISAILSPSSRINLISASSGFLLGIEASRSFLSSSRSLLSSSTLASSSRTFTPASIACFMISCVSFAPICSNSPFSSSLTFVTLAPLLLGNGVSDTSVIVTSL